MLSSKLQLLRLAVLLCLYHLVYTAFAAPPVDVSPDNTKLTVARVIVGIILILLGIIFCFFGRRFYRTTIFILGFYIGAVIAWVILQNAEPRNGYGGSQGASDAIYLVVAIIAGLVFGTCALCCSTLVIWVLGGLAGYLIALFILSFGSGGLIHSRAGRIVFIIAFILAGVILTMVFTDMAIIIGTAFIGAFSIILGVDMFARTGFAEAFSSMQNINKDTIEYHVGGRVIGMLIAMVVLFVLGVIVQWYFFRAYKFGHHEKSRWRWRRNRAIV